MIYFYKKCLPRTSLGSSSFQILDIWRSGWIRVLCSLFIPHRKMHNKIKPLDTKCCLLNPVVGNKPNIFWKRRKKKTAISIYLVRSNSKPLIYFFQDPFQPALVWSASRTTQPFQQPCTAALPRSKKLLLLLPRFTSSIWIP